MQKALALGVFIVFMVSAGSCAYNNEEDLYADELSGCDTANVTYSGTVLPILQASCLGCHSTSEHQFSGGNIDLEDFNSFKTKIGEGYVMGAITHSPGFSRMPKGGAKLDTCSIKQIQTWIDKGMKND